MTIVTRFRRVGILGARHILRHVSALRPILTCRCDAWSLTVADKIKGQAAEIRVLRLIKGITQRDRLRNEDIRAELQVKSILQFVEEVQLRWYGHVRRMSTNGTALRWPNTARPRGRPRKWWMDTGQCQGGDDLHWRRSKILHCSWKNFVTDRP